jgi:hypothetical protein
MVYYYAVSALAAAAGGVAVVFRASPARRRVVGSVVVTTVAAAFVVFAARPVGARVRAEHRAPYHAVVMGETIDALVWLRDNTAPDAVLVTNRAPYGVLWADRRTYTVPWVADREEILASIHANGVTHAVTNSHTQTYLGPVVDGLPEMFRPLKQFGSTRVYEVRRTTP